MRMIHFYKLCIGLGIVIILLGFSIFAFAATPAELRAQIEERSARIEKIEAEIRKIGQDITATSEQRISLENQLKQIEQERQHLIKELELTSTKIEKTNLTIDTLNNEITDKEKKIDLQKKNIGSIVRRVNEYDQYSILELLVAQSEISDFWQEVDNLLTLQDSSRRHARQLQGLKVALRGSVEEKTEQREALEELKSEIESQKRLVELNKKTQSSLVTETKNKEENYKNILASLEAQREAFEAEIRQYESQLKFNGNPTSLPARGSAPLSWPLDEIVVTQLFGAKTGPHRTYANGHGGTDFRARTPVKVYAMADGVVMGTGNTDLACKGVSYGNWITIDHDNNLVSTSAHLSIINVKKGARVTRGQVIGYSGNTGRSTAPHLHISLYAGSDADGNNPVNVEPKASISCKGAMLSQPTAPIDAYLDVLDYLPKLTPAMFKEAGMYAGYQN